MSYHLSMAAPLRDEVRRVAAEQLNGAIADLRDPRADRVTAIHDARKSVKKVRALLRLVEDGLPRAAFRHENRALRDAGRLLSGARDADVMVQAADDLRERFAGRVPATAFEELHAAVAAARPPEAAAGAAPDPSLAAAEALEAIAARIDAWPLEHGDRRTPLRGMARSYARGRRALRHAAAEPTPEALHEWRKRVKDLWYHERLMRELWPDVLKAQANATKTLSEHLGDDHDLAELRRIVRSRDLHDGDIPVHDDELVALVDERRAVLQAAAFRLGRRVYADGPKLLSRRLRRWSAAARDEARAVAR